jgi:apolipoprotein N-acyltransferase
MNYLLTLASGILTGLAMPGNLFSFLIWISMVPFLKNMANSKTHYERLFHTLIYSSSMLVTTLWWLLPTLSKNIPQILNNYPPFIGFLGFIGMIVLLIIPYLLIWLLAELYHRKDRKYNYLSLVFFYSFAYTSAEILRGFGDLAFMGGNLSYALYDHTGIIQLASIFGSIGLTFLIVLVNSLLAFDSSREKIPKILMIFTAVYLINFAIVRYLPDINYSNGSIKIGVVQTNVPQEIKYTSNIEEEYATFSKNIQDFQNRDVDLVVLPESAFLQDISSSDIITFITRDIQNLYKPVIYGSPRKEEENYYNSAWMYNEHGSLVDTYDKIKLTPFAEFLPYDTLFGNFDAFKLLSFYTPGDAFNTFEINENKIGVQICFETYFPEISINQAKNGANVLISITNDGWFNSKTALFQHFSQGVFRAVETRRDFIQVSNTGITGSIDKYGRITNQFEPKEEKTGILFANSNENLTFYTKAADILKILFFVGALLLAIL